MSEIGPTGEYPYGKINSSDEGEIAVGVASDPKTETVYINFGKPVQCLGMRPEHAEALAQTILKHAERARK